jgi:hypothetical protein
LFRDIIGHVAVHASSARFETPGSSLNTIPCTVPWSHGWIGRKRQIPETGILTKLEQDSTPSAIRTGKRKSLESA